MHCDRCDDPVCAPGLCERCEAACTCPECGDLYIDRADYDPDTHYACSICLAAAYAADPQSSRLRAVIDALLAASALRLKLLGALVPAWLTFLSDLHDTVCQALHAERREVELDALSRANFSGAAL